MVRGRCGSTSKESRIYCPPPWLEREDYRVVYVTFKEWLVVAPDGTRIKSQRDTGLCDRMLYIDIRKFKNVSAML